MSMSLHPRDDDAAQPAGEPLTQWGMPAAWDDEATRAASGGHQGGFRELPAEVYERPEPGPPSSPWRAFLGTMAALGFFLLKFGKVAFVAIKGAKFATTSISMLVSIAAYTLFWGWPFAVGFVLLLLVHELGHAWQMKREGLDAGAPVFIPFLGASIAMKQMPHDAAMEARVGLAGPIVGSAGALAVFVLGIAMDSDFLRALAFTAFFLNLFNLLPVSPLDGGRAMAAVSPIGWLVGLVLMVALIFVFPSPILILIAILAGWETWSRWRRRHEEAEYYAAVLPHQRWAFALTYLGLIAALTFLMEASYIPKSL